MFCTNCGQQMRTTDKFCAACGTPAAPPLGKSATAASQPADASNQVSPSPAPAAKAVPPAPVPRPDTGTSTAQAEASRAAEEEKRHELLQAEELAAIRDLAPIELLPDEFPPASRPSPFPPVEERTASAVPCPNCDRLNPAANQYCETCGWDMHRDARAAAPPIPEVSPSWLQDQQPARRPEPVRVPPPQVGIVPSVEVAQPPPTSEGFSYVYDDNVATKGNRTLLYVLAVVLALGILGVLYLLLRPSDKPAAGDVSVHINPAHAELSAGNAFDFAATVAGTGSSDVTWSVQEGPSGGKLVDRGAQAHGGEVANMAVYVAPPNAGTYHVVATSKADPAKTAVAEVTVTAK